MSRKWIVICVFVFILPGIACAGTVQIDRKFSLGMFSASGNSQSLSISSDLFLNANIKHSQEFTLKGYFDWGRSFGSDNMMKAGGSLRHGISFGREKYFFYNIEAEHDRFKDLYLRISPTVGMGYWFVDADNIYSVIEASLGYQSEIRSSGQRGASALEGRHRVRIKLAPGSELSNDLRISFADLGADDIRVSDIISLRSRINDVFNLKLICRDDYSAKPPAGVVNNDLQFTASIEYAYKQVKEE